MKKLLTICVLGSMMTIGTGFAAETMYPDIHLTHQQADKVKQYLAISGAEQTLPQLYQACNSCAANCATTLSTNPTLRQVVLKYKDIPVTNSSSLPNSTICTSSMGMCNTSLCKMVGSLTQQQFTDLIEAMKGNNQ